MRKLPYDRADRVASQIFEIVSRALINNIRDPRLKGVSATAVKVTKDLKVARIYFFSAMEKPKDECLAGFRAASGYLKQAIASELELRFIPTLEFFFDESIDYGEKIEKLLNKIRSSNT